jgi:4-hydroxybenzoate polyprenyltransferase
MSAPPSADPQARGILKLGATAAVGRRLAALEVVRSQAMWCKNELVTTALQSERSPSIPVKRSVVRGLVKTIRPHQWVKNVFVIAPMVFHKDLLGTTSNGDPTLNLKVAGKAFLAWVIFSLLAGAVYTINDLVDVEADRVHPVKRDRPIASGAVPESVAKGFAVLLIALTVGLSFYKFSFAFAGIAALYLIENLAYSFKLKKIAFLDVGLIAFGFVLRVVAGGLATDTKVSGYMLGCTALIALFLGFGKRRHELEGEHAGKQRAALEAYTKKSLSAALAITGLATAATYVAYTLDKDTQAFFQTDKLWLTVPFTLFGIGRFLFLVSGRAGAGLKSESPTQEMLSDVQFVLNLVLWVFAILAIVYRLRPG